MSENIKRSSTAYHGRRDKKARFLQEMRAHRKADAFLQGSSGWYDNEGDEKPRFFGCGIACAVRSIKRIRHDRIFNNRDNMDDDYINFYDHDLVARHLGISLDLAHAFETVFEMLPQEEAKNWPTQFSAALRPGSQPSFNFDDFDRAQRATLGSYHDRGRVGRDHILDLLRKSKPVIEVR